MVSLSRSAASRIGRSFGAPVLVLLLLAIFSSGAAAAGTQFPPGDEAYHTYSEVGADLGIGVVGLIAGRKLGSGGGRTAAEDRQQQEDQHGGAERAADSRGGGPTERHHLLA